MNRCIGSMEWLALDQGAHFTPALTEKLTYEAHMKYHFTTSYCLWANGTIESICKEVLQSSLSSLSEWKLRPFDSHSIVTCIQNILNKSPLRRLGRSSDKIHGTPLECFTGLKLSTFVTRSFPLLKFNDYPFLRESKVMQTIDLKHLQEVMSQIHKEVSESHRRSREEAIQ